MSMMPLRCHFLLFLPQFCTPSTWAPRSSDVPFSFLPLAALSATSPRPPWVPAQPLVPPCLCPVVTSLGRTLWTPCLIAFYQHFLASYHTLFLKTRVTAWHCTMYLLVCLATFCLRTKIQTFWEQGICLTVFITRWPGHRAAPERTGVCYIFFERMSECFKDLRVWVAGIQKVNS